MAAGFFDLGEVDGWAMPVGVITQLPFPTVYGARDDFPIIEGAADDHPTVYGAKDDSPIIEGG